MPRVVLQGVLRFDGRLPGRDPRHRRGFDLDRGALPRGLLGGAEESRSALVGVQPGRHRQDRERRGQCAPRVDPGGGASKATVINGHAA